jgi:4,5-dihydroxyphthalate decarboxylase
VATVPIQLVTRNYLQIEPLASGEVAPEGIELAINRSVPMTTFLADPEVPAGEMSFAQYVRRIAAGDQEVVGLPIFIMRGFRQRCFFVGRDSGLTSFDGLAGKRVGTNGWPDSGNTWSRSLLRNAGVEIDQVSWWVGPTEDHASKRTTAAELPDAVRPVADGETLVGMLMAGTLDAIMVPWPPKLFSDRDSPIRRLLPDFRAAELDYARQFGFWPGLHIIGVRASVLEAHPWVARSLYDAFDRAWKLTEERLTAWIDSTPWLQDDLEQIRQFVGPGWQAHGVEQNRPMIETFCHELAAQHITGRVITIDELFGEFERVSTQP